MAGNRRKQFKSLRHRFSVTGWTLVVYYGIMTASVAFVYALDAVFRILTNPLQFFETGLTDEMLEKIVGNAWGYFLAAAIGAGILLLWKGSRFCFRDIWVTEKRMGIGNFIRILCVFVSGQLVFQILATVLETILNFLGLSAMEAVEQATVGTDTFSMFLYAGILAPISEEILFRGLILRTLQPFGKKFAIIASAFLFGIFHGNLVQSPFAFVIGLVLGYTAVEYSVLWAMVLHMFNNLILSDVMSRLTGLVPEPMGSWISFLVILVLGLSGVVILLFHRRIKSEPGYRERVTPGLFRSFFTAPGVLVLTVFMMINMILGITAISG